MTSENDNFLLEKQYHLAIDARDKLNDNFHKWMTFYYVANGSILVAINSMAEKNKGVLVLSAIGIFICILWNLSCKGYYYWSKSWIYIIIALEKRLTNQEPNFGVYSVFSKKVADKEDSAWIPNKAANISTPKRTLLFSLVSIISWAFFSSYKFWILYSNLSPFQKVFILLGSLTIGFITYIFILPKLTKSRDNDSHILI